MCTTECYKTSFWNEFFEFQLPKIASAISILCSLVLIIELIQDFTLFHRSRRHHRTQQQRRTFGGGGGGHRHHQHHQQHHVISKVLLSVSVGDVLFSLGWFLGTWAADKENPAYEEKTFGTQPTCTFQGFLLQFAGIGGMVSNAYLGVVFWRMINVGCNFNYELSTRGRRVTNVSLLGIWLVAFGVACIPLSMDMYHTTGPACWIAGDDDDDNGNAILLSVALQVIPLFLVVLIDTILMCRIYYAVARRSSPAASSNADNNNNNINNNEITTTKEELDNCRHGDNIRFGYNFRSSSSSCGGGGSSEATTTTSISKTSRLEAEEETAKSSPTALQPQLHQQHPRQPQQYTNSESVYGNAPSYEATSEDDNVHEASSSSIPRNTVYGCAPSYHSSSNVDDDNVHETSSSSISRSMVYGCAPSYQSSTNLDDDDHSVTSPNSSSCVTPTSAVATTGAVQPQPPTQAPRVGEEEASNHSNRSSGTNTAQQALGHQGRLHHCQQTSPRPPQQQQQQQQQTTQQQQRRQQRTRSTTSSKHRSTMFAQQGILYIGGFLLTFGMQTVATLFFIITGSWKLKVDRAAYTMMALQGFWNFVIFSRRRHMKTWLGTKMKNCVWWRTRHGSNSASTCCLGALRKIKVAMLNLGGNDIGAANNADCQANPRQHVHQSLPRQVNDDGEVFLRHPPVVLSLQAIELMLEEALERNEQYHLRQDQQTIPRPEGRGFPLFVENAESGQSASSGATLRLSPDISSSDLRRITREWLSARIEAMKRDEEQYSGTTSGHSLTDPALAISIVDNSETTLDYTVVQPGAIRIGRDGYQIPTDDPESHLPSILQGPSSTATPHARAVFSASSSSNSRNSNTRSNYNELTEANVVQILREVIEDLLVSSNQSLSISTTTNANDCINTAT